MPDLIRISGCSVIPIKDNHSSVPHCMAKHVFFVALFTREILDSISGIQDGRVWYKGFIDIGLGQLHSITSLRKLPTTMGSWRWVRSSYLHNTNNQQPPLESRGCYTTAHYRGTKHLFHTFHVQAWKIQTQGTVETALEDYRNTRPGAYAFAASTLLSGQVSSTHAVAHIPNWACWFRSVCPWLEGWGIWATTHRTAGACPQCRHIS